MLWTRSETSNRALLAFSLPLFFLLGEATLLADSMGDLRLELLKSKDPVRRLELVREIGALAELEGASISTAVSALGAALLDEDVRVARTAVEILRRDAMRSKAASHLTKALLKQTDRQKSLIKTQDKNIETLVELMSDREDAEPDELEKTVELFDQFFESYRVVYQKINTSTVLIGEISGSLALYTEARVSKTLKKAVKRVHSYSPVESVPVMQAVLQHRSRSSVSVVVDLLQKYDYRADQKAARDFFTVRTGQKWIDWGVRYHRALSHVARTVDPDFVPPAHGTGTPEYWRKWFKENREKLPKSPEPMEKPPSVES